ncbi:MAG TPA: hypothetical protein VMH81_17955 [Bryobacteraceae bacterium]|nr:hypothetical protein [Bryobacteraceae bacterium]
MQLGASGDVYFMGEDGEQSYLYRVGPDGGGRRKVLDVPIFRFTSLSPDEQWASVSVLAPGTPPRPTMKAYPVKGGQPVNLCTSCWFLWAPDGGSAWITARRMMPGETATLASPLSHGATFPTLPPEGIHDRADLEAVPGAHLVLENRVVWGPGLPLGRGPQPPRSGISIAFRWNKTPC